MIYYIISSDQTNLFMVLHMYALSIYYITNHRYAIMIMI